MKSLYEALGLTVAFRPLKASVRHTPQLNGLVMWFSHMSAQVKGKYGGSPHPHIYKGFASMDVVKLDGKYLVGVSIS